jgi:hypothetical protein
MLYQQVEVEQKIVKSLIVLRAKQDRMKMKKKVNSENMLLHTYTQLLISKLKSLSQDSTTTLVRVWVIYRLLQTKANNC